LSTFGTKPSFSSHLAKYAAMPGDSGAGGSFSAVIVVSSALAAPVLVFFAGRTALLRLAMMVLALAFLSAIPVQSGKA
jgi:hypothetical protein